MTRGGARDGAGRPPAPTKQIRCYEVEIPRIDALKQDKETTADVIRRALDALEAQKKNPAD